MGGIMILFLAGLTALAFIVVALRGGQTSKPMRTIALVVAAAIVAYIGWIFLSGMMK
jgi:hypothetical protein